MNPFGLGSLLRMGSFRLVPLREDLDCAVKRFFGTTLSFTKNVPKNAVSLSRERNPIVLDIQEALKGFLHSS